MTAPDGDLTPEEEAQADEHTREVTSLLIRAAAATVVYAGWTNPDVRVAFLEAAAECFDKVADLAPTLHRLRGVVDGPR